MQVDSEESQLLMGGLQTYPKAFWLSVQGSCFFSHHFSFITVLVVCLVWVFFVCLISLLFVCLIWVFLVSFLPWTCKINIALCDRPREHEVSKEHFST